MVWRRNKYGGLFNTETRAEYHFKKNKEATNKAYDKYETARQTAITPDDWKKVKNYKDKYLKSYNKENDRNITLANPQEDTKAFKLINGRAKTRVDRYRNYNATSISEVKENNAKARIEAKISKYKKGKK